MTSQMPTSWKQVVDLLAGEQPGSILRIPKGRLPHPSEEGARPSIGMPEGQIGDFRFRLSDRSCLHVRMFNKYYEAHLDQVDSACDLFSHLLQGAPNSFAATSAGVGALVGLVVGGKKEGMLVGGLIGMVLGGMIVAHARHVAAGSTERSGEMTTADKTLCQSHASSSRS